MITAVTATLSTRTGKHAVRFGGRAVHRLVPRTVAVLGDETTVDATVTTALSQSAPRRAVIDQTWITDTARRVIVRFPAEMSVG